MNKQDVIIFVHAKHTSKRVPHKNYRLLGDKPLFMYAIDTALAYTDANTGAIVVFDTDSELMLDMVQEKYSRKIDTRVLLPRPRHISLIGDNITGHDLAVYQAGKAEALRRTICVQLVPTSPFISVNMLDSAITQFLEVNNYIESIYNKTVFSAVERTNYAWIQYSPKVLMPIYPYQELPDSQDSRSIIFETTGLYINSVNSIINNNGRMSPSPVPFYVTFPADIDINTEQDFHTALQVLGTLNPYYFSYFYA